QFTAIRWRNCWSCSDRGCDWPCAEQNNSRKMNAITRRTYPLPGQETLRLLRLKVRAHPFRRNLRDPMTPSTMPADKFWQIIERAAKSDHDPDAHMNALRRALHELIQSSGNDFRRDYSPPMVSTRTPGFDPKPLS